MSYFSATLDRILRDREMTQVELARKAQIAQGLISRYVNADGRPDIELLSRLTEALGEDGAELVAAYLRDDIPKVVQPQIEVRVHSQRVSEPPSHSAAYERLSARERRVLDELAALFERTPHAISAVQSILEISRID